MNFTVSDSLGPIGTFILSGALMIVFIVAAVLVVRMVRGRDDSPPPGCAPDDRDIV